MRSWKKKFFHNHYCVKYFKDDRVKIYVYNKPSSVPITIAYDETLAVTIYGDYFGIINKGFDTSRPIVKPLHIPQ